MTPPQHHSARPSCLLHKQQYNKKSDFAVPVYNIEETLKIEPSQIKRVGTKDVINIRGKVVSVVNLADVLELPTQTALEDEEFVSICVVGLAEKRIGLIIDGLLGNHEVVIKGLGAYFQKIKHMSGRLEKAGRIRFFGGIPYSKIPAVYNKNRIFINLSPSGLFDKTILEAMACETLALVSNKSFECVLPEELLFEQWSAKDLKNKIFNLFQMTDKQQDALSKKLRDYVIKNHNLDNLTGEINEQSNI